MGWHQVKLATVDLPSWGWTRSDDHAEQSRLEASVRAYGQLRALVVRRRGDRWEVVAGRRVCRALQATNANEVMVVDVGDVSDSEVMAIALSLEQRGETQYSKVAEAVATLVASGVPVERLASRTPFSVERLRYLVELTDFDWSTFKKADSGQQSMFEDEAPQGTVQGSESATLW